jgi:hemerythrin
MSLIEWNDSLRLGIASIDCQHERLVVLINSLHDAMIARHGNDALGVILDELLKYTDEHFSYEEVLFTTHGYRAASEHIALHRELVQQVCDFRDKFKSGRLGMSASVLGFLTQWLTQHICTEDEKYVRFLMAKGVR